MEAEKKRILLKAISNVQQKLAVADARLLAHRGAAAHDLDLAEALEDMAKDARKLANAFQQSLGAASLLALAEAKLPRPKRLSESRTRS